jgi:phosphoribosylanthranilate isomerase
MTLLERFFAADEVSLKICGITRAEDARGLVACGVEALGVNFWPLSKRFISPDDAVPWLHEVKGQIVRVGVVVNAQNDFIEELMRQDLIDVVQLHGEESSEQMTALQSRGIPCVRAYGVKSVEDLEGLAAFANADAFLLDTTLHAAEFGLSAQCGQSVVLSGSGGLHTLILLTVELSHRLVVRCLVALAGDA